MKINKDNYELYFINFLEGHLSPSEHEELMAFLILNPNLKDELEEMKSFFAKENPAFENVTFKNKENLKKSISDKPVINETNIDEFLIAYLENDLTKEDRERVETFLKYNPAHLKDFELLKKTYMKPDLAIVYNNKKQLKKFVIGKTFKLKYIYQTVAVAASLVLLINIYLNLGKLKEENTPEIVHTGNDIETIQSNGGLAENNTEIAVKENNTFLAEKPEVLQQPPVLKKEKQINERIEVRPLTTLEMQQKKYLAYEDRKEFSSIYHYVKQSEFNKIDEDYTDILPEQPQPGFLRYTADKLFANRGAKTNDDESRFGLWDAIDIGTHGINTLADSKLFNITKTEQDTKTRIDFAFRGNVVYSRTRTND